MASSNLSKQFKRCDGHFLLFLSYPNCTRFALSKAEVIALSKAEVIVYLLFFITPFNQSRGVFICCIVFVFSYK